MSKAINIMDVLAPRRSRGMVRMSITRVEDHVTTLQPNEKLNNTDRATVQLLLKRFDTLDGEFKTQHFAVLDLTDEETLGKEQAVLDGHDNKFYYWQNDLNVLWQLLKPRVHPNPAMSHLSSCIEYCII